MYIIYIFIFLNFNYLKSFFFIKEAIIGIYHYQHDYSFLFVFKKNYYNLSSFFLVYLFILFDSRNPKSKTN